MQLELPPLLLLLMCLPLYILLGGLLDLGLLLVILLDIFLQFADVDPVELLVGLVDVPLPLVVGNAPLFVFLQRLLLLALEALA